MTGLVMPPGDRTATAAGSDRFISDCEKLYRTQKNMCIKLGIKLTNTTLHEYYSFHKFKDRGYLRRENERKRDLCVVSLLSFKRY